jgi:transcriptional regulator with XRE-family HTH domain
VDEPTAPAPASVTLQDIADACGVTRATVSRALRGSPGVSEFVRAQIVATAERIGYRPNRLAQGLRNRRSHLVGLILTNLVNASFQTITEVMQARLDAEGYQTILSVSGGRLDQEERLLSMLFERQVDGVVMLGSDGQVPLSPLVRDAPVPVRTGPGPGRRRRGHRAPDRARPHPHRAGRRQERHARGQRAPPRLSAGLAPGRDQAGPVDHR